MADDFANEGAVNRGHTNEGERWEMRIWCRPFSHAELHPAPAATAVKRHALSAANVVDGTASGE
jgi:hypothetical protein